MFTNIYGNWEISMYVCVLNQIVLLEIVWQVWISSLDVASEHVLYMLLLEAALEDELVVAVDGRPGSAQLGREEGQQMLGLTMQPKND